MEKINISVNKTTHDRLAVLGTKSESFDTIIARLLDFYAMNKGVQAVG